MTSISTNGKLSIPTIVVLSFAIFLLLHSFATPLYAQSIEKGSTYSHPSSYPPITPTSSASPNTADYQPDHHSSSSTSNNQHHEQHPQQHSNDGSDGSDDNSDSDGGNNAVVEISTQ